MPINKIGLIQQRSIIRESASDPHALMWLPFWYHQATKVCTVCFPCTYDMKPMINSSLISKITASTSCSSELSTKLISFTFCRRSGSLRYGFNSEVWNTGCSAKPFDNPNSCEYRKTFFRIEYRQYILARVCLTEQNLCEFESILSPAWKS